MMDYSAPGGIWEERLPVVDCETEEKQHQSLVVQQGILLSKLVIGDESMMMSGGGG